MFLLMLCLTGLPLIFHEEIDAWIGDAAVAPTLVDPPPRLSADRVIEIARAHAPGLVLFAVPYDDAPVWRVTFAPTPTAPVPSTVVTVDARTGAILRVADRYDGAFTAFVLELHAKLLLGETGSLLVCLVGLTFVVAIVSGVVVYAPFMRRLAFGTVRTGQGRRALWLDLHNLVGIAVTAWLLVMGVTGIVNALSQRIAAHWQRTELADMIRPWNGQPLPAHVIAVQQAIEAATSAAPGMILSSIAMPGTPFAGPHHFTVFFHGATPLTSRILKPVLVDAVTGRVADTRDLPWYAKALFVSQPLHFGDYGSMPLKLIWACFDVMTIVILASGLYLWLGRVPRRAGVAAPSFPLRAG